MKVVFFTLCSVALILVCTISPGNLSLERSLGGEGYSFLLLKTGKFSDLDIALNILLFIPFGFTLTQLLVRRRRLYSFYRLAFVTFIAFSMSYLIELSQMFMSARKPSAIDVAANTTGAVIGYLFHLSYTHRHFTVAACLYAAFVLGFAAVLQQQTSLRSWDLSFPLMLGNERTGDRPWKGRILEVHILDKALSANDLGKDDVPAIVRRSGVDLLKSHHWKVVNPEIVPMPLIAPRLMQDNSLEVPVGLHGAIWLKSVNPPEEMTQRLINSSQFTLLVKAATADTTQKGPARIVSLSWDANNRNFTLGQAGRDMIFRLRTPVTTENGTRPELRVPGVFADSQVQTIAITYDGSRLVSYINGIQRSPVFELTPGYVALSYVPNIHFPNMHLSKIIFYPMMLFPLGALVSLVICSLAVHRYLYGILTIAVSLLFSAVLESVLLAVSGKNFDYESLALGLMSIAFGVFLATYLQRSLPANDKETLVCQTLNPKPTIK